MPHQFDGALQDDLGVESDCGYCEWRTGCMLLTWLDWPPVAQPLCGVRLNAATGAPLYPHQLSLRNGLLRCCFSLLQRTAQQLPPKFWSVTCSHMFSAACFVLQRNALSWMLHREVHGGQQHVGGCLEAESGALPASLRCL
jgi:hypothetical protein